MMYFVTPTNIYFISSTNTDKSCALLAHDIEDNIFSHETVTTEFGTFFKYTTQFDVETFDTFTHLLLPVTDDIYQKHYEKFLERYDSLIQKD